MTKRNDFIWKAIQVASWLIFLGLCILTGTLLFNYIFSLFKPVATHNLFNGLDLSELYEKHLIIYNLLFIIIIILAALKAYVFYLVIRMCKKLNLVKPFSKDVSEQITKISYFSFSVALITFIALHFTQNLIAKGYNISTVGDFFTDSGAFLIMATILYIIALIFKKGIELQNENDLTV